jgi:hypothetical protein
MNPDTTRASKWLNQFIMGRAGRPEYVPGSQKVKVPASNQMSKRKAAVAKRERRKARNLQHPF